MSVNKVILVGRLAKDPEVRYTGTGTAVCNIVVVTSDRWKDKEGKPQERAEFHRCVLWGKNAENAAKYLKKGSEAYVEGSLETRNWEDKEGQKRYTTEVKAQSIQFIGSLGKSDSQASGESLGEDVSTVLPGSDPGFSVDEIPF